MDATSENRELSRGLVENSRRFLRKIRAKRIVNGGARGMEDDEG